MSTSYDFSPPGPDGPAPRRRGTGLKIALVGAGIAVGAITATAIGANAATSTGSGSTATGSGTTSAVASTSTTDTGHDHHGAKPVRADEKAVSAANAAKVKAAALKAVPGGAVYRVESDSGDATYEAHMTKADGTDVTVKFDKNLKVTGIESGMGK